MALLRGLGSIVLERDRELMRPALERGDVDVVRRVAGEAHQGPHPLQPDLLKNMIDRVDAIPERSRLRPDDYIHVSSLVDLCPRQYHLAREHGTEDYGDHLGQNLTGGHHVTYALGRAVGAYVKERVVAATRREDMYGLWMCRCGYSHRTGLYVAEQCSRCGGDRNIYNEPVLRNVEYRITGRPDITLVDPHNHILPIEVKSMARERWEALRGALADHILQALLYRWLYEQGGRRVHTHVVVLYVAKEFRYGSPYKEYHVDARTPYCTGMVTMALELAAQVRDAQVTNTAPPRELCAEATCARARSCPVRALCFNME